MTYEQLTGRDSQLSAAAIAQLDAATLHEAFYYHGELRVHRYSMRGAKIWNETSVEVELEEEG